MQVRVVRAAPDLGGVAVDLDVQRVVVVERRGVGVRRGREGQAFGELGRGGGGQLHVGDFLHQDGGVGLDGGGELEVVDGLDGLAGGGGGDAETDVAGQQAVVVLGGLVEGLGGVGPAGLPEVMGAQ